MELGQCLLITHPNRLGDTVMSIPLTKAISKAAEVDTNVGSAFRFLLDVARVRAGVAEAWNPKGVRHLLSSARQLRSCGYGAVFLVRPNFRSALLARMAGIPIRVGDATEGRGLLLTHRARVPKGANQLERLKAFGARVGLTVSDDFGIPRVAPSDPPVIGLAPAASYEDKFIPTPVLRHVAEHILDLGFKLALVGGPLERPHAVPLADLPHLDWVGTFSLPELLAPLSSLRAFVGADGGLYHLSVACGVPSVGVYGPTRKANWWHNWGPHHAVLAPGGKMDRVTSKSVIEALERSLLL